MTVFDNIKSKNIDEFAEWLDKYGMCDNSPWISWWDKTYCNSCDVEVTCIIDPDIELECSWCELNGKCKYFKNIDGIPNNKQIIKMWLESENR